MQKMEDETCPQLLDLIPKERNWLKDESRSHHGFYSEEEKELELKLGPPVQDTASRKRDESLLSLGYLYNLGNNQRHYLDDSSSSEKKTTLPSFLQFSHNMSVTQRASQLCCTKEVDLQSAEERKKKKGDVHQAVTNNNTSQKRTAPAPVVGWPPVRSFRKNLASTSSSKPAPESQNVTPSKVLNVKPVETSRKGMFVKINMDGVPIGRKVNLGAYTSYEKLASAVDELFRGLLEAQRDSGAGGINNIEEEKEITGLLDASGEYALVYEGNEGDRKLIGDVPWHVFVSTVKRLRVLKSSELSTYHLHR